MPMTRREFVTGGVAAFTMGFAAPAFLSDIALAQGGTARNLVVLYLSGGNDSLSTVIPYTDPQYYARRPTIAIPAANVLQIGTDRAGTPLGLNPRLTGLRAIFNAGRLAIIQRTGYANSSRSHFQGTDIWSTGDPASSQGAGWLGRYLDLLPAPVDPLTAWSTVRETPHTLLARTVGVASIPSVSAYAFASPNGGADAVAAKDSARPHRLAPAGRQCRISRSSTPPRRRRSRPWIASRRSTPTCRPSRIRTTASRRRCARSPGR